MIINLSVSSNRYVDSAGERTWQSPRRRNNPKGLFLSNFADCYCNRQNWTTPFQFLSQMFNKKRVCFITHSLMVRVRGLGKARVGKTVHRTVLAFIQLGCYQARRRQPPFQASHFSKQKKQ